MKLNVSQVLARANAVLVQPTLDVTGALATLVAGVTEALPATAAAILVEADGRLEVLAATSHRAVDLELHHSQVVDGPSMEAIRRGETLTAVGFDAIDLRWPSIGAGMRSAGYAAVVVAPLRWRGRTFGALNVFRRRADEFDGQLADCRAFADAATLILAAQQVDDVHIAENLAVALRRRAVVEQAKGALAYSRSLDMAAAFEALLEVAEEEGITLGVAADRVMARARSGDLDVSAR